MKTTTYYVPAIISLAVISATTQSLAINLTQDRERGLLKRVRGTPLPTPSSSPDGSATPWSSRC